MDLFSGEQYTGIRSVIERVRQFACEQDLWHAGERLLVAVSGGPDSVMLLDLLHTVFAQEDHLRLAVAHVHHGLRAAADTDVAFVEELADRYNLPFLLRRVDVPRRVAETGESVEEAARELRYAALAESARAVHADAIVTGHTADDQAETVLMRVLRGTGLTGLAGIPPRRGAIIRPLLPVWRSEVEMYLRTRGLASQVDESNLTLDFTRNRVRLELLPQLEREYAPRLRERLHHLAELARQDNDALDRWTDEAATRLLQPIPGGVAVQPQADLPQAVRWRLWRRAIAEVRGGLADISFEHLADIQRLMPGGEVHLPGVRVLHEAGRLVFLPSMAETVPVEITLRALPVPGTLCLPEAGCCLTVEERMAPCPLGGGDIAVVDADAVRGALTVRSWQPGDRFRPLGAPGSRKLQDIFVDAGVPRRLREHVPVVLDEDGIIWIAGFRPADRVKIVAATTRCLCITVEWELNPWTLQRSHAAP